MKVNSLTLQNFKNYQNQSFSFSDRVNVICGENAQGKTNLLESIFFLSCVKPIHAKREHDLITFGKETAKIHANASSVERNFEIDIDLSASPRKIFVNGIRNPKVTEYIGLLKTVLFIPDDLSMIKEGPAVRRRFMNIAISQLKPNYVHHLSKYNRLLEQKNKLLKQDYFDDALLDVYNENLAATAAQIILYRSDFIDKIGIEAQKNHYEMSKEREILQVGYKTDRYIDDFSLSASEISHRLYNHMNERKLAEKESQSCLIGPHRDDIVFLINEKNARDFASQGQIRTAILATKLAERDVFYQIAGEYPILLLDDVLSELDTLRQNYVLNKIDCGQVFITSCENLISPALAEGKIFTINQGSLIDEKEF